MSNTIPTTVLNFLSYCSYISICCLSFGRNNYLLVSSLAWFGSDTVIHNEVQVFVKIDPACSVTKLTIHVFHHRGQVGPWPAFWSFSVIRYSAYSACNVLYFHTAQQKESSTNLFKFSTKRGVLYESKCDIVFPLQPCPFQPLVYRVFSPARHLSQRCPL